MKKVEKNNKFSPIPWTLKGAEIFDANGGLIAEIGYETMVSSPQDALLIQVSPLMYQALQVLLYEAECLMDHCVDQKFIDADDESIEGVSHFNAATAIARQALALAEGRDSNV